jgi:hypothetical protein
LRLLPSGIFSPGAPAGAHGAASARDRSQQPGRVTVKSILLLSALSLSAIAIDAHAGELQPKAGLQKTFQSGASAILYFTKEAGGGDRLVTTVQTDNSEAMKIFRFISVLSPGQSVEISVPRAHGEAADVIVVHRVGDRILVDGCEDHGETTN